MALVEISTKAPKANDRSLTVTYDFGENAAQAIEMYGDEQVHSGFISSVTVDIQRIVRTGLEKGVSDEDIQKEVSAFKPGVTRARVVDPVAAIMRKFPTMSAEERQDLIAKLQATA